MYSTFLINRVIVVEPTSLIAYPFSVRFFFFVFSRALLYSAFCFKAVALITLEHDVSFAWWLSLKPAIGQYWERWFVLMMGGNEGEMTKRRKMMWDRRRGGAVKRNVAAEPQIMAQMKLIQPFTFWPIINCLSVHQDFIMLESGHCQVLHIYTELTWAKVTITI